MSAVLVRRVARSENLSAFSWSAVIFFPVLMLLRSTSFVRAFYRADARVHQDVLEGVPRYGPTARRLLLDELPSAAALRLVDPSGEHAARKLVAGHPSHMAELLQGVLRYFDLKLFARD
jgi:hypothetical protein